jgi:hypothetical protein
MTTSPATAMPPVPSVRSSRVNDTDGETSIGSASEPAEPLTDACTSMTPASFRARSIVPLRAMSLRPNSCRSVTSTSPVNDPSDNPSTRSTVTAVVAWTVAATWRASVFSEPSRVKVSDASSMVVPPGRVRNGRSVGASISPVKTSASGPIWAVNRMPPPAVRPRPSGAGADSSASASASGVHSATAVRPGSRSTTPSSPTVGSPVSKPSIAAEVYATKPWTGTPHSVRSAEAPTTRAPEVARANCTWRS